MNTQRTLAVLFVAGLGATLNVAHADDVCSAAEHQAANAQLARARAAEASGNSAGGTAAREGRRFLRRRHRGPATPDPERATSSARRRKPPATLRRPSATTRAAWSAEQYEDPKPVDLLANAKRVALAMVEKQPTNRQVARNALEFMNRKNQTDGVTHR